MKKIVLLLSVLFAQVIALGQMQQTKMYPVIKSYGPVYQIQNAAHKPDPKLNYKIIVELQENASKPDSLNEYLEAIATLINLHAVEGVPKENIHVVVVL